jgi:hypothetical protein
MLIILFDAQMVELSQSVSQNPFWIYSFWNGFKPTTQDKILWLTANCLSVQRIAVYREQGKWNTPEDGTYLQSETIVSAMWY